MVVHLCLSTIVLVIVGLFIDYNERNTNNKEVEIKNTFNTKITNSNLNSNQKNVLILRK